ncbi:MAG TPA: adenylyltransferase/cytidyltransferase family protein [Candidatus Saccharimonadales bacterium]|nr:adenylyltransferase/cytidyltransferase family protein [Candidatus Saccharimonadales bacterium]
MIVEGKELSVIRADLKDSTIALRFGCYDILHAGHQEGIDFATAQADVLAVGVMPDSYIARKKGIGRPVNGEASRVRSIDEAVGVDYSFIAPASAVAMAGIFLKLRPDIYIEDEAHAGNMLKLAFLRGIGTEYVIERVSKLCSTSEMIAELGLAEAAAKSSLSFTF